MNIYIYIYIYIYNLFIYLNLYNDHLNKITLRTFFLNIKMHIVMNATGQYIKEKMLDGKVNNKLLP